MGYRITASSLVLQSPAFVYVYLSENFVYSYLSSCLTSTLLFFVLFLLLSSFFSLPFSIFSIPKPFPTPCFTISLILLLLLSSFSSHLLSVPYLDLLPFMHPHYNKVVPLIAEASKNDDLRGVKVQLYAFLYCL